MKKIALCLLVIVTALSCRPSTTAAVAEPQPLPEATPEEEGLRSDSVAAFINAVLNLESTETHHLVVMRHGKVVAQVHPAPFEASHTHTLYSASKTLTALAVGCAIDDNRLRLDDRVVSFFPKEKPDSVSKALAAITVRDLLTMNSGIKPDWNMRSKHDDWVRQWLAKPVTKPGVFQYDSMCTYMLSAIVQRATGRTMMDYVQSRVLTPMGITTAQWELSPEGINTGGWGLRMNSLDQAKLGQLMLQRGKWEGQQIVSAKWIDEATRKQTESSTIAKTPAGVPTEGNQGYGYQVWRCIHPTAYRADGAFAQYIVVDTATETVVVFNGVSGKGHDILAAIWRVLLSGAMPNPLPANAKAQKALAQLEANAALPCPEGKPAGTWNKMTLKAKAASGEIDSISAAPTADGQMLVGLRFADGTHLDVPCSYGRWATDVSSHNPPYSITARGRFTGLNGKFATAGAFAWQGNELTIKLFWPDWITGATITLNPQRATGQLTLNYAAAKPIAMDVVGR